MSDDDAKRLKQALRQVLPHLTFDEELIKHLARKLEDKPSEAASTASGTPAEAKERLPSATALHTDLANSAAEARSRKVSVIGVGAVGMATAYSILNQGLCSRLALVDVDKDKLEGEAMDLAHGGAYCKAMQISASTDVATTADSDLVIITSGVRQRPHESRLSLVERNCKILMAIVPEVVRYSPKCVIMVVSNPVDILSWIAWKISGLPLGRVFGSGTTLDSSRFRTLIANRLGVCSKSVHGYVVGEHGDSSVPVWSSINVGGVLLSSIHPKLGAEDDPEDWKSVHTQVIKAASEIIKKKGYTNWAVGLSAANIAQSVLRDENRVLPVSILARGHHGIEGEVFLSLPCSVGNTGVSSIFNLQLSAEESTQLQSSATTIAEVQASLQLGTH